MLPEGGFELTVGYRYMKSFRHFVGTTEQHERFDEASQVINHLHLFDFGVTHGLTDRTSVSVNLPFMMADRSQPIRVDGELTGERNETSARGIGDLRVTLRRWMFDPVESPNANVQLGVGFKLPTGAPNETAVFRVDDGAGGTRNEVRSVDQSIQPGDGGFGLLFDLNAFAHVAGVTPYAGLSYLVNPSGTNGVQTFRSRPSEAIMSIADQYSARAGVNWAIPGREHVILGLGARIDGVPVHDLVGSDAGFRRPGYAVSVEPSVAYTQGQHLFTLSLPWAVQRNRERSVTDRMDDRHGDAAFADWMLLASWTMRW